ncbi:MAG: hypothetical protein Q7O66_01170 [Dehalococcoidia bacterium]|nr:hypothetical protein [Dehalococcoidia bacterium]
MTDILCTVAPKDQGHLQDIVAVAVSFDEPCMGLSEVNLQSPDSKGFRRYRTIYVMRADRMATFLEDMGSVALWPGAKEFRLPGGVVNRQSGRLEVVHTVGELYDIANHLRTMETPEEIQPRDLWTEAKVQADEKQRQIRHASTFAEGVVIQRS